MVVVKRVKSGKRSYQLYVRSRPAVYELWRDGDLLGTTHAYHLHAGSWVWELISANGQVLYSGGRLSELKRAAEFI